MKENIQQTGTTNQVEKRRRGSRRRAKARPQEPPQEPVIKGPLGPMPLSGGRSPFGGGSGVAGGGLVSD